MALRPHLLALLAAVVFATAACGASTSASGEAADAVDDDASIDDEDGVVSLGEREAGFGPGSLVVTAGSITERLWEVDGGWFVAQPFTHFVAPDVCGFLTPVATQGLNLSRTDSPGELFGDVMVAEVLVYETAEEAAAHVELLNADTAEVCDQAILEAAEVQEVLPPGVEFDEGSGVGVAIEPLASAPADLSVASRRYLSTLSVGSLDQDVEQIETWISSGRYLIRTSASSALGNADSVADGLMQALFSEPLPPIEQDADLDAAIDAVRTAVLDEEDLPELFDAGDTLRITPGFQDDGCFGRPDALVATAGPQWLAVSPGVGASEVRQRADVYVDAATAAAAFDLVVELGGECFADEISLPDTFRLVGSAFETQEVDGRTVALAKLDYIQLVGAQEFDVEVQLAITQVGRYEVRFAFFGLAGDAPDLPELAVLAAAELAE